MGTFRMNDQKLFENSRSGDFKDMERVEAACRRWERDLPSINRPAYGRYASKFCYGRPGVNIELRKFEGNNEEFLEMVSVSMRKRFYQLETRR